MAERIDLRRATSERVVAPAPTRAVRLDTLEWVAVHVVRDGRARARGRGDRGDEATLIASVARGRAGRIGRVLDVVARVALDHGHASRGIDDADRLTVFVTLDRGRAFERIDLAQE